MKIRNSLTSLVLCVLVGTSLTGCNFYAAPTAAVAPAESAWSAMVTSPSPGKIAITTTSSLAAIKKIRIISNTGLQKDVPVNGASEISIPEGGTLSFSGTALTDNDVFHSRKELSTITVAKSATASSSFSLSLSAKVESGNAVLTYAGTGPTGSKVKVYFGTDNPPGKVVESPALSDTYRQAITADKTYYYRVELVDENGNVLTSNGNTISRPSSSSTADASDSDATIRDVEIDSDYVTSSSAMVHVVASEEVSRIEVRVNGKTKESTHRKSSDFIFPDLDPKTEYDVRVRIFDENDKMIDEDTSESFRTKESGGGTSTGGASVSTSGLNSEVSSVTSNCSSSSVCDLIVRFNNDTWNGRNIAFSISGLGNASANVENREVRARLPLTSGGSYSGSFSYNGSSYGSFTINRSAFTTTSIGAEAPAGNNVADFTVLP